MTAPAGIFDAASLGELRDLKAKKRTATCDIERRSAGGTWLAVAGLTGLPVSYKTVGAPSEGAQADAAQAVAQLYLGFAVDAFDAAAPTPKDRVRVAPPGGGAYFFAYVVGVFEKSADATERRLLATRTELGG